MEPFSVYIQPKAVFLHRFTWKSRHCHQLKIKLHTSDKGFGFHAFDILYDPVVRKNGQLVIWKYH